MSKSMSKSNNDSNNNNTDNNGNSNNNANSNSNNKSKNKSNNISISTFWLGFLESYYHIFALWEAELLRSQSRWRSNSLKSWGVIARRQRWRFEDAIGTQTKGF